jgi:hypothetical protein
MSVSKCQFNSYNCHQTSINRLMNKLRKHSIVNVDPKDDGFIPQGNLTRFLAACSSYGLSNDDLFRRDDLVDPTSNSLANTVTTLIQFVKTLTPGIMPLPEQTSGNAESGTDLPVKSLCPYTRAGQKRSSSEEQSGVSVVASAKPRSNKRPRLSIERRSPDETDYLGSISPNHILNDDQDSTDGPFYTIPRFTVGCAPARCPTIGSQELVQHIPTDTVPPHIGKSLTFDDENAFYETHNHGDGGVILAVYDSSAAEKWIETHQSHPVLASIRKRGIKGPFPCMFDHETVAFSLFVNPNTSATDVAKALAEASSFFVIIRDMSEDPSRRFE